MSLPDWTGQTVAIVASGPSITKADVQSLRGRCPVIAIKENYDLCQWADVVYGCDFAWWRNRQGLKECKALKIAGTQLARQLADDIVIATVRPVEDSLIFAPLLTLGAGGNSGFQAVNLAVQLGARRLLLLGFDMSDRSGVHWYGRNSGMGRSNPSEGNFRRWRAAFVKAAPVLQQRGVEVINAAPFSALTCFPRMPLVQALQEWKLESSIDMAGVGTA